MDSIVRSILELSEVEEDIPKLHNKLTSSSKVIKRNASQIDDGLDTLQLGKHTLGYIFLLFVKINDLRDHNKFIMYARKLMIDGYGHHMRMCAKKMTDICEQFKSSLIITESFINGVLPLSTTVLKMAGPNKHMLTAIHPIFLLVCLKAHCYRQALEILKTPVYEINPKDDNMKPIDYLSFQFYAGNIFCGVKKFAEAIERYQMALTMPSNVISQIQVESFKRYILSSLLVHGSMQQLPQSTTSHVVNRNVEKMVQPYTELVSAYKKDVAAVRRVIGERHEAFSKDKNFGLVNQVLDSLIKRNIKRLTNTYVVLSLKEIAETAELGGGAEEAERHVRNMIQEGSINARINQRDGMLKFLEDKEDYASTLMAKKLDAKIQEVMSLSKKLSEVNKEILLSAVYIQRTIPRDRDEFKSANTGMRNEDAQLQQALAASVRDQ